MYFLDSTVKLVIKILFFLIRFKQVSWKKKSSQEIYFLDTTEKFVLNIFLYTADKIRHRKPIVWYDWENRIQKLFFGYDWKICIEKIIFRYDSRIHLIYLTCFWIQLKSSSQKIYFLDTTDKLFIENQFFWYYWKMSHKTGYNWKFVTKYLFFA